MRLSFSFAQLPIINCIQSGGHLCRPAANFIIPKNKDIYLQYFLQYFFYFFPLHCSLLLLNSISAREVVLILPSAMAQSKAQKLIIKHCLEHCVKGKCTTYNRVHVCVCVCVAVEVYRNLKWFINMQIICAINIGPDILNYCYFYKWNYWPNANAENVFDIKYTKYRTCFFLFPLLH